MNGARENSFYENELYFLYNFECIVNQGSMARNYRVEFED
jgi:hypothetical protein